MCSLLPYFHPFLPFPRAVSMLVYEWKQEGEIVKNTLELKREDLPVSIRLKLPEGTKEYVLVKTKQDGLLLNKPQEVLRQPQL